MKRSPAERSLHEEFVWGNEALNPDSNLENVMQILKAASLYFVLGTFREQD
jgi:hypothetical protein